MSTFQQECHHHIIPSRNEMLISHFPLSVIHCLPVPQISHQETIKQCKLQLLLHKCELTKMCKSNFVNLCEQHKIYPQKIRICLLRDLATMLWFQSELSSCISENSCYIREVPTFLLTYAKMHGWKSFRPTLPLLIFLNILKNLQVKATNFNTGRFFPYEH